MTLKTEKRVVFYPVLIGGKMHERCGVFDVTFDANGLPTRAEMLRFLGYRTTFDLVNFYDDVEDAILNRQNLHCLNVLDLDGEAWDGSLNFEPKKVLL